MLDGGSVSTQFCFSTAKGSQTACSETNSLGIKPVLSCTASFVAISSHGSPSSISALSQVSVDEWHGYIHIDKSDTVEVSPVQWWASREDRMPILASIAALYLHFPATSVDVKILFSNYTVLLTQYRKSLTEINIKIMLIAKFNCRPQD